MFLEVCLREEGGPYHALNIIRIGSQGGGGIISLEVCIREEGGTMLEILLVTTYPGAWEV